MTTTRHNSKIRRAFSLVEMIVVIAIIILLVAIVFTVGPAILGKADETKTENTLKLMDAAIKEWSTQSQRSLRWADMPAPDVEVLATDSPSRQLTLVLNKIQRIDAVKEMLEKMDPALLRKDETTMDLELYDGFGSKIYMIHPGRIADATIASEDRNDDGTVYINDSTSGTNESVEQIYGICINRQVLFVSAGPDKRFGDLSAAIGTGEHTQTLDNIYSYQPETP